MKRMSIRSYILVTSATCTLGFIGFAFVLLFVGGRLLGFGYREVLITLLLFYPVTIMSAVYGFYKGLVRHYGFEWKERLFPFDFL
jgi:hypothetical protein